MKKRPSLKYMMESSLKTEVQQLEKCLKDQFAVRRALEKALRRNSSSIDESSISYIPKPTKELIMDIAMLELEVVHLERYLLSLYRRAFEEQAPNVPILAVEDEIGQPLVPQSAPFTEVASHDLSFRVAASAAQSGDIKPLRNSSNYLPSEACSVRGQEKNSCRIRRSHSSIVQHTVCSAKGIPCAKNLPLSFFDHEQIINSGVTSLAEHLGTTIAHHIPETPNRLSEDMVRLMCAIYCKLKDHHGRRGISSSPTSSFSSSSSFSPRYTGESRSPCHKRDAMIDAWFGNSRCSERWKELSGPYNMMVEVFSFCKASRKCNDIEEMLQKYK